MLNKRQLAIGVAVTLAAIASFKTFLYTAALDQQLLHADVSNFGGDKDGIYSLVCITTLLLSFVLLAAGLGTIATSKE